MMTNDDTPAETMPAHDEPALEIANLKKQIEQLEQEITASKSKIRLLLATIPVALILVRADGSIEVVNTVAQEMFGYSRASIADKSVRTLLPSIEQLSLQRPSFETYARHISGASFPVEIAFAEVPTPDGNRFFVFVTNISERHKLEQLKRDFFAMVSHDLRAPLMNISGVLELTASGRFGDLSETGRLKLDNADKSLERLLRMISDLLEIEKLDHGSLSLSSRLNNLTLAVAQAVSDVSALASEKEIELSHWSENVNAQFDNDRINRLLVNLISNAIKFSPEKSQIRLEYESSPSQIEVRIIDQGQGVPPESIDSIFDKYTQADSAHRGGVGLGLAICKAIADAHGGQIGVRNNDGPGSTFWFTLPISEAE